MGLPPCQRFRSSRPYSTRSLVDLRLMTMYRFAKICAKFPEVLGCWASLDQVTSSSHLLASFDVHEGPPRCAQGCVYYVKDEMIIGFPAMMLTPPPLRRPTIR